MWQCGNVTPSQRNFSITLETSAADQQAVLYIGKHEDGNPAAQLEGQKPRPDIKPSVLEASKPTTEGKDAGKRPGSAKRPKTAELTIHHEVPLHAARLPVGATFRGYEAYVVQELQIKNETPATC